MQKENEKFEKKQVMCIAGWGTVCAEKGEGHLICRFVLEDDRICIGDKRLVWKSIEGLIAKTKVGRFADEMDWSGGEGTDFTLSIKKVATNRYLPIIMDWLQTGEASTIIERGIEVVLNNRGKAVEIDLLQGSNQLHPEHIRSIAEKHGVRPCYAEQMRSYAMDVEGWPMSIIPTCPVTSGAWIGEIYAEHATAQPLIRTTWGWITLQRGISDSVCPKDGVIVAVSMYESMKGVEDSLWGMDLDENFSAWHQHFSATFPYLGEHVELVETDKHYQTFCFAVEPGFESEGWSELLAWLESGVLDREIERYSIALNLEPGLLPAYFNRVAYPESERADLLALSAKMHAQSKENDAS